MALISMSMPVFVISVIFINRIIGLVATNKFKDQINARYLVHTVFGIVAIVIPILTAIAIRLFKTPLS